MAEQPTADAGAIELRIDEISQLFDTLDAFPFRERDLDKEAEEFIVGWAREMPGDQPLRIIVHLPESQASNPQAQQIEAAITGYFSYRTQAISRDLKELFHIGRRTLAIGLAVLSFSIVVGQVIGANVAPPLGSFLRESLTIFGWVANWKPIEIFLYDWWPIARRRNLYRRLSESQVQLRPYKNES